MGVILKTFYHTYKFGMNFFWILYLYLLTDGRVNWFGHIFAFGSIMFMISNVVYWFGGGQRG